MLVHLIPAAMHGRYAAGNWKDFASRAHLLQQVSPGLATLPFEEQQAQNICELLPAETTAVLCEYSKYLEMLQSIRSQRPHVRIHVRAHNAEALQHRDRANPGFLPTYDNLRNWYGVARLGYRDRLVAQLADSVLGISEWDSDHYWSRLSDRRKLFYLPYVCPWPLVRGHVQGLPWEQREPQIVCMPGGGDRLSQQQAELFGQLALKLQATKSNLRCLLSRGIIDSPSTSPTNSALQTKQFDEPWDCLCSSRAVAMLTDAGYGMKTTIVDGLAAGCHVLVHKGLMPKLPPLVARHCFPVDPGNLQVEEIDRLLRQPPSPNDVHDQHVTMNLAVLRKVL